MADPAEKSDFVGLLTSHQRRLHGYIATLLPNPADCEEVLQQANLVLWTKRASFVSGTSFRAWAFRIAQLEVMGFRRRRALERRVFTDELVEIMAGEVADRESASLESRIAALHRCLAKLSDTDRQLIDRRYWEAANVRQMGLDRNVVDFASCGGG